METQTDPTDHAVSQGKLQISQASSDPDRICNDAEVAAKKRFQSMQYQVDHEHGGDVEHGVDPDPQKMSTLLWVILCGSILVAEMQSALETTMTANLQPTILNALGQISKFPWINVTYSLGAGGTCLFWGKLFGSFDSKMVFLVARLLFATGSALSAAAPSMDGFVVGKAITGVGGSGTYIGCIIIITTLVTEKEQGRYYGYIGFMWGLGTILGPVIGSAFAVTAAGWRWSFYFNLILVAVTLPAFLFILPSNETETPQPNLRSRIHHIDLVGSILFAGALSSGVMALSFGGGVYSWASAQVIGLFCCSGSLWILFVLQQTTAIWTTKNDRILPVHVLLSGEMWLLILQIGCPISIMFITVYYIPLYFQFVRGETAIRSAVDSLPFLITLVATILVSGRLIGTFGYYKTWFIAGSTLALVMSICLYNTEVNTSHGKIYGYIIIGGIGTGLYMMNAGPIMSTIVPAEHVADTGTIFGAVDLVSSSIAVAIANSIFLNRATDNIQAILPHVPRSHVQEAIAGVGASITEGLSAHETDLVLQAIMDAIKSAWTQVIATACLSVVLSLVMRNQKLGR